MKGTRRSGFIVAVIAALVYSASALAGAWPGLHVGASPQIEDLTVTPQTSTIATGASQQYKAIVRLSDGTTQDVTNLATWSVSSTSVARVGRLLRTIGAVSGLAEGSATISAAYKGWSASARLNDINIVSQRIDPANTGVGISGYRLGYRQHYIYEPTHTADRKPLLVIFLGGSSTTPSDYTNISERAAGLGYGVLDLSYPDGYVVGELCKGNDSCFGDARGATVFGNATPYEVGDRSYTSSVVHTTSSDSIVNRIVNLLDTLASQAPDPKSNPDPNYWGQFLVDDPRSSYVSAHYPHGAVPNWSRIILVGHSQGAGDAAFLAIHLPENSPVYRVVMLSGPQDCTIDSGGTCTASDPSATGASWVADTSATPMNHFWGLYNDREGSYGDYARHNWARMQDGSQVGAGCMHDGQQQQIVDGSANPNHRQLLGVSQPDRVWSILNHNSTAANRSYLPAITQAWDYLISGGHTD